MNWVDLAVLAALLLSGLLGLARGLVREALGLAAWVLAAWAAFRLYPAATPPVQRLVGDPSIAAPIAFGVIFLVALVVLSIVVGLLSRLVRFSVLGGLDRTLGFVYGLVRGAVLVVAAYVLAGMAVPVAEWPAPVLAARALPIAWRGAAWAASEAPPAYRPHVEAPPGRTEDADALMQATPTGRLFSPRDHERETR